MQFYPNEWNQEYLPLPLQMLMIGSPLKIGVTGYEFARGIGAQYKQNRTLKQDRTKIFLKPDRDQTEVFSTSNKNGYATEYRGLLSNQNFIDLIQIMSVFCNIYLLASPQS